MADGDILVIENKNKIGDIKRVGENKYFWAACTKCGAERWVRKFIIDTNQCRACFHKSRRGISINTKEYIVLPNSYVPVVGEIRCGREIGQHNFANFIWQLCIGCGKGRWVHFIKGEATSYRCITCNGAYNKKNGSNRAEKNYFWNGGRIVNTQGYICIKLSPDDFYYPMTDSRGYVMEHRLVVAKKLNRCLLRWEIVHHKDGIKNHNEIENLELLPHGRFHLVDSITKSHIKMLEEKIKTLEAKIVELEGR